MGSGTFPPSSQRGNGAGSLQDMIFNFGPRQLSANPRSLPPTFSDLLASASQVSGLTSPPLALTSDPPPSQIGYHSGPPLNNFEFGPTEPFPTNPRSLSAPASGHPTSVSPVEGITPAHLALNSDPLPSQLENRPASANGISANLTLPSSVAKVAPRKCPPLNLAIGLGGLFGDQILGCHPTASPIQLASAEILSELHSTAAQPSPAATAAQLNATTPVATPAQPDAVNATSLRHIPTPLNLPVHEEEPSAPIAQNPTPIAPSETDTRRSGRQSVPSKCIEAMQEIGTNVPKGLPLGERPTEKENFDLQTPPEWATLARDHLLTRNLGSEWRDCVSAWLTFEGQLGYGTMAGTKVCHGLLFLRVC